jgi:hypothetical protein
MSSATASASLPADQTFEMNGKGYRTDAETLAVLRSIVPSARATGDSSAVEFLMGLGIVSKRIVEMSAAEFRSYAA